MNDPAESIKIGDWVRVLHKHALTQWSEGRVAARRPDGRFRVMVAITRVEHPDHVRETFFPEGAYTATYRFPDLEVREPRPGFRMWGIEPSGEPTYE